MGREEARRMARCEERLTRGLAAMRELAASLGAGTDPATLLDAIAALAARLCDGDVGLVGMLDPTNPSLVFRSAVPGAWRGRRVAASSLAAVVARWNRVEVIPDAASDPRRGELEEALRLRRMIVAPIQIGRVSVGAVVHGSTAVPSGFAHDAPDAAVLSALAAMASAALSTERMQSGVQAYHAASTWLAATPLDGTSGRHDDFQRAIVDVARRDGIALVEHDPVEPWLAQIGSLLAARAACITRPSPFDPSTAIIAHAWRLDDETRTQWQESGDEAAQRAPAEGLSRVLAATADGFPAFATALRTSLPGVAGTLHVLADPTRPAFGPFDVRLAELAATRIAPALPPPPRAAVTPAATSASGS